MGKAELETMNHPHVIRRAPQPRVDVTAPAAPVVFGWHNLKHAVEAEFRGYGALVDDGVRVVRARRYGSA